MGFHEALLDLLDEQLKLRLDDVAQFVRLLLVGVSSSLLGNNRQINSGFLLPPRRFGWLSMKSQGNAIN